MTFSTLPLARLKRGRATPVRAGHPWIFSEALDQDPKTTTLGQLVRVEDANGDFLGIGTHNHQTSIRIRLLTHTDETIDTPFFLQRFQKLAFWKKRHLPANTTGFRLVHAEADGFPGLIVDLYDTTAVFQIHTAGMENLREFIVQALKQFEGITTIIERSDLAVRKIEGLKTQPITVHHGQVDGPIPFLEAGLHFFADVLHGQKTGFFLDQREARLAVQRLAKDRRILNLFAYSGAFSVHAARGGAKLVTSIDISHTALEAAVENFRANHFDPDDETHFQFLEADVLDILRDETIPSGPYDLIICDPPAFAKSAAHVDQALKAYTQVNQACFSQLSSGGILVSSSCSGRITTSDFQSVLRLAAGRAGREAILLDWMIQPADHPETLAFPEGKYLKTAIIEVK